MRAEFSEIQFMFGIVKEMDEKLEKMGFSKVCPFFPSQSKEQRLGYDLKMDVSPLLVMFIQFKVAEHVSNRRRAYEWKIYQDEYYRFHLYKPIISNQHNILIDLANADKRNSVHYIAPCFYKNDDYLQYYFNKEMLDRSVKIDCCGLSKLTDNARHSICYRHNGSDIYQMSEPKKIKTNDNFLKGEIALYDTVDELLNMINNMANADFRDIEEARSYLMRYGIVLSLWRRRGE